MRKRLRKYVSVVMTLLLCVGLCFQHGQTVWAADTATVIIIADDAQGSQVTITDVDISNVTLGVSEDGIVTSAEGTFSLTSEQIKLNGRTPFGIYPTDDRIEGAKLNEQSIDANGLRITSDADTGGIIIELYGVYGAAHQVTYYSNETMDGSHTNDTVVPIAHYQTDLSSTTGNYVSVTDVFGEEYSNPGYFFIGWKEYDSGDVSTVKTTFTYTEKEETSERVYAHWQEAATLTVTYYETDSPSSAYTQGVVTQQKISDTKFSFKTPEAPVRDGYVFDGWVYTDAVGAQILLDPGIVCDTIEIDPNSDEYPAFTMDFYGKWTEALPSGSTISTAGMHTLQAGTPYTLGSGSWTVTYGPTADSCVYAGGSTFYVGIGGSYTFTATSN